MAAQTIVEPVSREEIAEALSHLSSTAGRMPAHWHDRKALIHERMNELLDMLDAL